MSYFFISPNGSGGGGDVTKVGTPANNQVGIWTGDGTLEGDTALTFDTATDTLTSVTFAGNLTGNVTGNVSGTSGSTTGNAATVTVADAAADTTTWPLLATAITGAQAPATDAGLTYNASTNVLAVTAEIALGIAGSVSGVVRLLAGDDIGAVTITAGLSGGSSGAWTLPVVTDTFVGKDTSDLLSNKTLISPQVNGSIKISPLVASGDLTSSGLIGSVTVDTNAVGVGAALFLAADGHYDEADADAAATMPCTAIALATGTGAKNVLFNGFVRNDAWTWTVGGIIYVSATQGTFTQTAPSGTGDQVQAVGVAQSATVIYFNPSMVLVQVV